MTSTCSSVGEIICDTVDISPVVLFSILLPKYFSVKLAEESYMEKGFDSSPVPSVAILSSAGISKYSVSS